MKRTGGKAAYTRKVNEMLKIVQESKRRNRSKWRKAIDIKSLMAYTEVVISNNVKGYAMKITKQTVETVKTIVIAVLVTGIIAFVGGMKYEAHNAQRVDSAVKSAVQNVKNSVAVESKK